MWLFCTPAYQGADWACVASPVFVITLLLCVSGVPLQERQAQARWGADPAFQAWRARTWLLFPLGPRWCVITSTQDTPVMIRPYCPCLAGRAPHMA